MKYVVTGNRGWDHSAYWTYLASVKDVMAQHMFGFASDPANHNLDSPNSLHDAWLERWNIIECGHEKNATHTVKIEARLLGPHHDRTINLIYLGVEEFEIVYPGRKDEGARMAHGDLLVHELRMATQFVYVHELVFSSGAVFLVQFRDLVHRVDLLPEL
jgi:hypothetical protein